MPAKAAVRSPERTQTCHDAKAFWGHFQDECEDETEGIERGAFRYYYYYFFSIDNCFQTFKVLY